LSDIEKLAALRCEREPGNLAVKPIDILRAAAHDLENGQVKCDGVLILFADRPAPVNESWTFEAYRAGLTRDQEVVLLTMSLERTIRNWRMG
jgi:hypothetical protein